MSAAEGMAEASNIELRKLLYNALSLVRLPSSPMLNFAWSPRSWIWVLSLVPLQGGGYNAPCSHGPRSGDALAVGNERQKA